MTTVLGSARRPGAIRAAVAGACLVGVVGGLGACTSSDSSQRTAADVIHSLGAVPIPSAPATVPPATGTGAKPVLAEMGAPVLLTLPDATVRAVALGPTQDVEYRPGRPPPTSTDGTMQLELTVTRGSLTVRSSDLSSRDETGTAVRLRTRGARSVTVHAGRTAQLTVVGRYDSGAAQLSWTHHGRLVALWDFNIELD